MCLVFALAAAGLHAQTLAADKTALTFSAQFGGQAVPETVNLTASGGASVFYIASVTEQTASQTQWLKVSNASNPTPALGTNGTTPSALTVTADPTSLAAGTYDGQVLVTTLSGSSSVAISVVFTVSTIGVYPTSLTFAYQIGSSLPGAQSITLTGASSTFSAAAATTSGGNWLDITPASGVSPGAVTALLDPNVTPTLAAGTYNGIITITPTGASGNVAVTVPVTLNVTAAPTVTVGATSLQLNYQIGGANNLAQQTLTLSTNSSQAVNFGLSASVGNNPAGRNWILINPASGQIPANGSTQVIISYDTTANLPAGSWPGTLTLFTSGTAQTQQSIGVNLLVSSSPLLSVSSPALNFVYELDGTPPPAQTVTTTSTAVAPTAATGQMPIGVSISSNATSWIAVTPPSGVTLAQLTTGMTLSVAVNGSSLSPGKYSGTITITGTGAGNAPQTVTVNLTVANDPAIVTNNNALAFADQIGQTPVAASQTSQTLVVSSSNGATLNYAATVTLTSGAGSWLVLSGSTSGSTSGNLIVTVVPGSLTSGTYTGNVILTATNPATGNAAINSPLTIPVTLYVSNSPLLVATLPGNPPSQPSFTAQVNGSSPTAQNITLLSSTPATALTYSVSFTAASGGSNWLFVAPQSGSTAPGVNTVTISVLPGLLSPGTYTGTISITASGPGGTAVANATAANPMVIPVTFQVTAGTLELSPTALTFAQVSGGPAPANQTVQVSSNNGAPLNFTAVAATNTSLNWLSVTPTSGITGTALTVSVNAGTLSPGNYGGTITITSPNAATVTLNVTLNVTAGTIAAAPTSLTFTQTAGGPAPAAQTINVTGTPAAINFTVSASATNGGTWLTATPTSGSTPGTVQVSASAGTLPAGQYSGTVTISASNVNGSPINIPVTLNVVAPQTATLTPAGPLTFSAVIGATAPAAQQLQLTSSGSAPFTAAASTKDGAGWLSVTPASGTASATPTTLNVAVNLAALNPAGEAGNYTGTITVSSPNFLQPLTVTVNLSVVAIPAPVFVKVANAASYISNAISPGELVIIGGTGVGPAATAYGTVSGNSLSTTVGGTQVFFDNTAAPIYYATSTQTAVFVPYEVAGRPSTAITVKYQGVVSNALTYTVTAAVPGIFTLNQQGSGPGAILNQDYSVNGPNNGAAAGTVVSIYMTGEGETSPAGITGSVNCPAGQACNPAQLPIPLLQVTATVGGVAAKIDFAGEAPGDVSGVMQVNLEIPAGLTPAAQPVVINVGSNATQTGVTVQTK
jgi:uncharacterized protein (TIGR03437 family)